MRFLNTSTLELEEFNGGSYPQYAVLSHVWGNNEFTYADFKSSRPKENDGYRKLLLAAKLARDQDLSHIWIDTCCIDHSNVNETNEVVNATFRLFRTSAICLVLLEDVKYNNWREQFPKSKWHTRIWTLPELLAPLKIRFYSHEGDFLDDKTHLAEELHRITTVPLAAIEGASLSDYSPRERMEWAKERHAVRAEDEVYALLGMFDVSMPLLYGEGYANALWRLQALIPAHDFGLHNGQRAMRLILSRSKPLRLAMIPVTAHLQYAILSHTWEGDEVTFDDMRSANFERRRGYRKLLQCCKIAAESGYDYVWVDTCCIDKSSSSELQEAICSMYRWYQDAAVCYAYLADYRASDKGSKLAACRWFKRGWTLQELIAPNDVQFFDQDWVDFGTKMSLSTELAEATSIDIDVLRGADPKSWSVAQIMSWSAHRTTTRIEDVAYSLMGLFGIFIPMLYGEGDRAFQRLQEEILKQTDDYTIFAWRSGASSGHTGIFASSPRQFHGAQSPVFRPSDCRKGSTDAGPPPTTTSRGVVLNTPVQERDDCTYVPVCYDTSSSKYADGRFSKVLCIRLQVSTTSPRVYARSMSGHLYERELAEFASDETQICVLSSAETDARNISDIEDVSGMILLDLKDGNGDSEMSPPTRLVDGDLIGSVIKYKPRADGVVIGAVKFRNDERFAVIFGRSQATPLKLWCKIVVGNQPVNEIVAKEGIHEQTEPTALLSSLDLDEFRGYGLTGTDHCVSHISQSQHVVAMIRKLRSNQSIYSWRLSVTLSTDKVAKLPAGH